VYDPFPEGRPAGLRRRALAAGSVWWRIDAQPAGQWSWTGFPEPRNRFDPASGRHRVRYAAATLAGAARERYLGTGRYIPADHGSHQVVRLEAGRSLRVLDLRTEANLDALGVDDRISTGREAVVWAACHALADAVCRWWTDPGLDGILYRSRTTPATSANLAFWSLDPFRSSGRRLERCPAELADLVLAHGFTIGFDW
jgi:hypothetical protein